MRHSATLCFLMACGLSTLPPAARADIFDDLAGTYGTAFRDDLSCASAPHRLSFSPDHRRAHFEQSTLAMDYRGQMRSRADYTVLGADENGVRLALDGETRLTGAGTPVIWVLRPQPGFEGYCWGRTDWPPGRCQHLNLRCKDDLPLG